MITGSIVALVSPMHSDGSLDWGALKKLIEFHIEAGTQAIVSVGTTGESATLSETEHCEVIKFTIDKVSGRIPVIAGTGANSTTEAIKLTQCAKDVGADAALLVTPYYNKPTQEGLYLHHKKVADTVAIPQILYNVPGRTACDMLPETVARLAEVENIVGIKDATGDLDRLSELVGVCFDGFAFYSGDDLTSNEFMLRGGHGTISVTANVAPKEIRAMCDAALVKESSVSGEINGKLNLLHKKLFVESSPIPVKWALFHMGLISSGIRLPLTELAEEFRHEVKQALVAAEIIS